MPMIAIGSRAARALDGGQARARLLEREEGALERRQRWRRVGADAAAVMASSASAQQQVASISASLIAATLGAERARRGGCRGRRLSAGDGGGASRSS